LSAPGKIAHGLLWLVSGRLVGALLSIVSTAVLARLLTPGDFGIVAAAMVVLGLANVLFDGAFGVNLMRKKVLRAEDVRTTLTAGLVLAFLILTTVVCLAPAAETFFGYPELGLVLAVSSATIPLKAVAAIATAKLQREGQFRVIAGRSVLAQSIGYLLVGIPLSLLGAGLWALVAAMVVAGAAEAGFAATFARLSFRPAWDPEALRDVRATSLFSVANVMNWVANAGANAIVGRSMGATDLGLYSRGWKLLDLLVDATATPLSKVLLPKFAALHGNDERLRNAFLNVLGIVLPGYGVLSALLALQAPLVVTVALGSQWHATIPVAQILFATLLPRCAFKVSENFAIALGRSAATAARQGLYAMLMLAGAFAGLSHGIAGVALGTSAAITIFYLTSMAYVVSTGKVPGRDIVSAHLRAALLAACAGLADAAVLLILEWAPLLPRHLAAGSTGALVAAALVLLAPGFFIGQANAASLTRAIGSIRSTMSPSRGAAARP
jgi:O-antigen/teichoic acid export membrane protein